MAVRRQLVSVVDDGVVVVEEEREWLMMPKLSFGFFQPKAEA